MKIANRFVLTTFLVIILPGRFSCVQMINKKKMKITTKDEQRNFSRELWLNRITKADGKHVTPYFAKPNPMFTQFVLPAGLVRIVLVTSQPIVPGQQCSMNADVLYVGVL